MMRVLIMLGLRSGLVCALVVASFGSGCSSESDSDGAGGGPYAPPGNGVAISESLACETVRKAEIDAFLAKGCGPLTRPACPDYLRSGRPACMQYDQGTVQGCVDYVNGFSTCDEIGAFDCVVKELAGTEGAGCP
jgi:hypothetical protein